MNYPSLAERHLEAQLAEAREQAQVFIIDNQRLAKELDSNRDELCAARSDLGGIVYLGKSGKDAYSALVQLVDDLQGQTQQLARPDVQAYYRRVAAEHEAVEADVRRRQRMADEPPRAVRWPLLALAVAASWGSGFVAHFALGRLL